MICENCGKRFKATDNHYILPEHGEWFEILGRTHAIWLSDRAFCSIDCAKECLNERYIQDLEVRPEGIGK